LPKTEKTNKSKDHEKTIYIYPVYFDYRYARTSIPQPQSTSVPSIKIGKSTNFELKKMV
jgi:hypothetical protein